MNIVGNELIYRFKPVGTIKMVVIEKCLIAFKESSYQHLPLFKCLYEKFDITSDKDLSLSFSVVICNLFLKNDFRCEKIMHRLYNLY